MKKLAVLLLINVFCSVSFAQTIFSLRLGPFGSPGIQVEYKKENLGIALGVGVNPVIFEVAETSKMFSFIPFDICFNYYFLGSGDDVVFFFDFGSSNYETVTTGNTLAFISSNIALASGIGLSPVMWNKIYIKIKLGV
mgnify:FL=1